ncbi:unnamed protein product [Closterium sp. NIES-64]|nr:unnamed protein product [Closterium sp. NIES-64]
MDTAVLIPIKYLASGISYVDMSYLFGVSKTLCHEVVDVFLTEFPSIFKAAWVRFPTREELPEMAREFAAIKGVPAVVGAVDGTHIHMKGMEGHRAEYWTRKSAYAVQLQLTCDARGRIWDYLIGYPGSAHDMRVFKESALLERLHNGDIAPYQIVGDAAYPLREYCLTPLHAPRGEDLMDDWAQCFNYCQSTTRMAVERCIGAFKGRWRIFGQRNDCRLPAWRWRGEIWRRTVHIRGSRFSHALAGKSQVLRHPFSDEAFNDSHRITVAVLDGGGHQHRRLHGSRFMHPGALGRGSVRRRRS